MTLDFKDPGDIIYLIGQSRADLNSSEYLHKIRKVEFSPAPYFDLQEEVRLHQVIGSLIDKKCIQSAHDVSEGGLLITLLESCFPRNLGLQVSSGQPDIRKDAYWFGESQSRVVVSVQPQHVKTFEAALSGFPCEQLGTVTSGALIIEEIGRAHV